MLKVLKIVSIYLLLAAIALLILYFYNTYDTQVPETAVREERQPPLAENLQDIEKEPYPNYDKKPDESEHKEEHTQPELLPRIAQLRKHYNNPDIVGFIEIPNTNISYPVAQTGNNEFYLYHDLNWNTSSAGSIFLDYENDLYALTDHNTIIYGHNMRNGSKFHNIRYFHRENFFRTHTYILLDTPYKETVWDIFSFFHTTIEFCYLTTNFFDEAKFYEFMLLLQSKSRWSTEIEITQEDQILILSTCGVHGGDNRYVLVARLRYDSQ